jgi:hypothetical protein
MGAILLRVAVDGESEIPETPHVYPRKSAVACQ